MKALPVALALAAGATFVAAPVSASEALLKKYKDRKSVV